MNGKGAEENQFSAENYDFCVCEKWSTFWTPRCSISVGDVRIGIVTENITASIVASRFVRLKTFSVSKAAVLFGFVFLSLAML